MGDGVAVAARLAQHLVLLSLFGLAAFPLYAPGGGVSRRALGALTAAALALAFIALSLQTAGMAGDPAAALDPALLQSVIAKTRMGHAWTARVVSLMVLLAVTTSGKPRPGLSSALAAVALASLAWGGHGASGAGLAGVARLIADILHLLVAGLWLGALIALSALIRRSRAPDETAAALGRFSGMGSLIVATLTATGAVNAATLVDWRTPDAIAHSLWAGLLAAKLGLFVAMLALAAANRFVLTPRLRTARTGAEQRSTLRGLRASLAVETGLGVLVIATVAWLGVLAPPGG